MKITRIDQSGSRDFFVPIGENSKKRRAYWTRRLEILPAEGDTGDPGVLKTSRDIPLIVLLSSADPFGADVLRYSASVIIFYLPDLPLYRWARRVRETQS